MGIRKAGLELFGTLDKLQAWSLEVRIKNSDCMSYSLILCGCGRSLTSSVRSLTFLKDLNFYRVCGSGP